MTTKEEPRYPRSSCPGLSCYPRSDCVGYYPLSAHCGQGFVTLLPDIKVMVFLKPPMISPVNVALSISNNTRPLSKHSTHTLRFSKCTCPGQAIEQVSRQKAFLRFSLRDNEFHVQAPARDAIYCHMG